MHSWFLLTTGLTQGYSYFLHADQVGLCVYRQRGASTTDRNASFLALGVLAAQGHDISSIWLHADPLLRLSEKLLNDVEDTPLLEAYWESHQPTNPKRRRSSRPRSRSANPVDSSLFNPLTTIPDILQELGPLIFPLWRAALLRERILIMKQPPMRSSCEMGRPTLSSSLEGKANSHQSLCHVDTHSTAQETFAAITRANITAHHAHLFHRYPRDTRA